MTASLAAKAAGVIGVAAVGSTGTVFTYKAIRGFYEIEKEAVDPKTSWNVTEPTSEGNSNQSLMVKVHVEKVNSGEGSESNTRKWECKIIASPATDGGSNDSTTLKNALDTYFSGYKENSHNSITISPENRWGFVKSCSRNRKEKQSHTEVNAELKISMGNLESDLKKVFGGFWKNKAE